MRREEQPAVDALPHVLRLERPGEARPAGAGVELVERAEERLARDDVDVDSRARGCPSTRSGTAARCPRPASPGIAARSARGLSSASSGFCESHAGFHPSAAGARARSAPWRAAAPATPERARGCASASGVAPPQTSSAAGRARSSTGRLVPDRILLVVVLVVLLGRIELGRGDDLGHDRLVEALRLPRAPASTPRPPLLLVVVGEDRGAVLAAAVAELARRRSGDRRCARRRRAAARR